MLRYINILIYTGFTTNIYFKGNTTVDKAHANILKLYQLIHKHIEAHPEDTKRFINFPTHSGVKPIYAKGANGPLKGSLNLAEYFVRLLLL